MLIAGIMLQNVQCVQPSFGELQLTRLCLKLFKVVVVVVIEIQRIPI